VAQVQGQRIGWLDSVREPARIHRTIDGGQTTVCGHYPAHAHAIGRWVISCDVPRHVNGRSRYCKTCFKDGGKTLPWVKQAPDLDPNKKSPYYRDVNAGPSVASYEIERLAKLLVNTRENVYTQCSRLFKATVGDEIFDRLRKLGGIFKCENCDYWRPVAQEDKDLHDICVPCVEKINEGM